MPTRIGLMGLGRIGRNIFRILYKSDDLRIEAISDVADQAALAYLLRFDTILGRFPDEVSVRDGHLYVAGRQVTMLTEAKGSDTTPPWGDLGVDTVIEATSKYRTHREIELLIGPDDVPVPTFPTAALHAAAAVAFALG